MKDQTFNQVNPDQDEVPRQAAEITLSNDPVADVVGIGASESETSFHPGRFDLGAFLGLLAGETGEAREGERDIIASAIRLATDLCDWKQLPSLARLLYWHAEEINFRAERAGRNTLSVRGQTDQLAILALCAAIQTNGFVDADERQARSLAFLALVDLAAHSAGMLNGVAFKNMCAGLRVLINRLSKTPHSGADTTRICVWQLIDWVSGHRDFAEYAKSAFQSLQDSFVVAWRAAGAEAGIDQNTNSDDEDIPLSDGLQGCIWALAPVARFESKLPDDLSRNLLSAALTRITAVSRYTRASLLLRSPFEMKEVVSGLLSEVRQSSGCHVKALAHLLSIAACTDLRHVGEIRWASGFSTDHAPPYPGLLTPDGRWLVRSELDPRTSSSEGSQGIRFRPRTVHIPIPRTLAEILVQQRRGNWAGESVLLPSVLAMPIKREGSAWQTTISAALMRDRRFGISSAQHVMHTSFGLDTAPLFYDRVPAEHLAHLVAQTTYPWFGEKPRPPATNLPEHNVGSQRIVGIENVTVLMRQLREHWSDDLDLWQKIQMRVQNLAAGLLLSIAGRYSQAFCDLSLISVCKDTGILRIADKEVSIDHPGRLGVMGSKVLLELRRYLCELQEAVALYAGTDLGNAAVRILNGDQPLLLVVMSPSCVREFGLDDLLKLSPQGADDIENWGRQFTLDGLSARTHESVRAAVAGWTGTRAGAISEMCTASPLQVLQNARTALDGILEQCSWRPLQGPRDPKPKSSEPWPHWVESQRSHLAKFREDKRQLERSIQHARQEFAEVVAPAVTAYFRAIKLGLSATPQGLVKFVAGEPPALTRQHHQEILSAMMSVGNNFTLARELLHDWLEKSRESGITEGPLPRKIHRSLPSQPSPFLPKVARALAHREAIRTAAFESALPPEARTFLVVLLDGWVPDAKAIVQLMKPGALLHDLAKGDILLIEATAHDGACSPGCFAFRGASALALRAWHRGKQAVEVDFCMLGKQLHDSLSTVLSPRVSAENVVQELETLMRADLALRTPGIMQDVASRRVVPTFASIERVAALEEGRPIWPDASIEPQGGKLSGGLRKARKQTEFEGYDNIKDVLRTFERGWSPRKDIESRNEAIASLYALIPEQGATTGMHIIALYAASYIALGISKEHVRPVTVIDAVMSIGTALMAAIPEQFDVKSQEAWQAVYARAIANAKPEQRQRLAGDIAHFQKIMARDHALPSVEIFALLDALDVPNSTESIGFLTPAEQAASMAMANLRVAIAEDSAGPNAQKLAICIQAILYAAHSSSLRDREFRLPQIVDWCSDGASGPYLRIRSNGLDFIKSTAGRRAAYLSGPYADQASVSIDRLAKLAPGDAESAQQKLFVPDAVLSDHDLNDALTLINSDLRYVVANPLAGIELTRKTWALKSYRNLTPGSFDLWPAHDFMAEMGQARIGVMQGYYLHSPLAFSERMPRETVLAPVEAGWLLGMSPKSAQELIKRPNAWLWKSTFSPSVSGSMDCAMAQDFEEGLFEPSLREAERLVLLLAAGASPRSALSAMAWPLKLESTLQRCMDELASFGVSIGEEGSLWKLAPPARAHSEAAFHLMRTDAKSWQSLAWIFSTWLADWRARDEKGISARNTDWERHVGTTSAVSGLDWTCVQEGHLNSYRLDGKQQNAHSPWPTLRWMSFSAWIRKELISY